MCIALKKKKRRKNGKEKTLKCSRYVFGSFKNDVRAISRS